MDNNTADCIMSKKSKRTMNSVDGIILKGFTGIFRSMGKEYNDILRALEVVDDKNKDISLEETINKLINDEEELKEKLKTNLERLIKIRDKILKKAYSSTTAVETCSSTIKQFDPSKSIPRNGSIYLSKNPLNCNDGNNKKDPKDNCLVPAKNNQKNILVSMPLSKVIINAKPSNKIIRRSINNLLRPIPSSSIVIEKLNYSNKFNESLCKIEKNKTTFNDDQKLELCDSRERRKNFKKKVTLRRSISESNLLDEVPIVENQLLKRHKMKENSNYWTPLDLGGSTKEENAFDTSEIKHILPINTTHTFAQKKGFNIRCCYCPVRKFTLGDKLVCVCCGIEMHITCKKLKRNVPCVVMERRRKIEQTKYPVYLGKICTTGRPMIPAVLIRLVDRIETSFMLTTPGLYCHVPEKENDQNTLKAVIEEKFYVMFDEKSVFSVPNALKRLLKNLVEAIVPPSSWPDVCLGVKEGDYRTVYNELLNFPVTNKDTLAFLIRHLQIVIGMSDRNDMTLQVIVNQFAPLIVGLPKFKREKYGNFNDCTALIKETFQFLMEIHFEFWDLILRTSKDPPFCIFMRKNDILKLNDSI
ncbi:Rac GTPase-activating protein 1 [Strongyloides ratti]|uniref:Rac GTPase-activating protein 1 n=1 Tax=Strongyloides ratti TaxID=34506 RepID=A0A090L4Z8_STRRB|nr:Rac GTPase-activating protein 1 [Strongyloides ratti]CEF62569.1 Rac GTPase-activating protein 1 [Strongyloides ratti]